MTEADRVLVAGWSSGIVKNTGRVFDNRRIVVFNIRDGRNNWPKLLAP